MPAARADAPHAAARPEDELDPRRWAVLALAVALFVCSQFYRVTNAVVAPELQADLRLSSEALGAVSAAFFYAFAVAQVPLALLLDRLGPRRIMAGLTLVGAAGAVVFAGAAGAAGAIAGRALLGLGMAGNLMGTLKLVASWFPGRRFATLAGVVLAVGTIGNVLAATPLVLLVRAAGWRQSFVLVAIATAAIAALFWLVVRDAPARPPDGPAAIAAAAEGPTSIRTSSALLLRSREFWLISFGSFTRYGSFVAIQGLWIGPWLADVVGLGKVDAANLILALNAGLVVGAPLGGWLSDHLLRSRKGVALLCLGGVGAAELALALAGRSMGRWTLALVLVAFGIASSFAQVLYAHVKDVMPARMAGMAMTGTNFFVMLGAASYLHAMGWLLDRTAAAGGARTAAGYETAFLIAGGTVLASFLAYLGTRDARPAEGPRT